MAGSRSVHECKDCGMKCRSPSQLKAHERIHSGLKPYKCDDCGRAFNQVGNFNRHQRLKHTGKTLIRTGTPSVYKKCKYCDKKFPSAYSLQRHERIHSGLKPYKCDDCGRAFNQLCNFNRHQRLKHTGKKPFECSVCPRGYFTPNDLNQIHCDMGQVQEVVWDLSFRAQCGEGRKNVVDKAEVENPLFNPLVLDVVFGYLKFAELKKVQVICHLWANESLKHLRKSATLVLLDTQNHHPIRDKLTLQEFIGFVENDTVSYQLGEKPFERYNLQKWNFIEDPVPEYNWFLDKFGKKIKHIHFFHCSFKSVTHLMGLIVNELPNLESIVLSSVRFQSDDRPWTRNPERNDVVHKGVKSFEVPSPLKNEQFWKILYRFPNVTRISIKQQDGNKYWGINDALLTFCRELEHFCTFHNNWKIESLDLIDYLTDAAMPPSLVISNNHCTLERLRFPLQNLSLDMSRRNRICVGRSIKNFSDSLKVLKLFRSPITPPFRLHFSKNMTTLRELYLFGNLTTSLEFLRLTPNLKVLVLNLSCYEQRHKLVKVAKPDYFSHFEGDPVMETSGKNMIINCSEMTLKKLEHFETDYNVSPSSLQTLSKWMPNLKTLKMVLKKETVPVVCNQWPNLWCLEGLFESNLGDVDLLPLVSLKALSSFKLNVYCKEAKLSDSCAHDVFLKMDALEELSICVSEKMKQETELALGEKIRLLKINRNYDPHNGDCCSRRKFSLRSLHLEKSAESRLLRSSAQM